MEIGQESSQIALLVARRQLQARQQSGFFEAVGGVPARKNHQDRISGEMIASMAPCSVLTATNGVRLSTSAGT